MRDDFLRKEGLSNDIAREIKLSTKMLDVKDAPKADQIKQIYADRINRKR